MSGPRKTLAPRLSAAAAALGLLGTLGACTAAADGPAAAPSPTAISPSASPEPSASASPASPSAPEPTTAELTLEITIADGKVTPSGKKIEVAKDTLVTLSVTSDIADELHAHTAGDGYELRVQPGRTVTGSFVAADTGTFEVESHETGKIIVILIVR